MGLPYGEEIMIIRRTMWRRSTSVTDRQMDRITMTIKNVQRIASHGNKTYKLQPTDIKWQPNYAKNTVTKTSFKWGMWMIDQHRWEQTQGWGNAQTSRLRQDFPRESSGRRKNSIWGPSKAKAEVAQWNRNSRQAKKTASRWNWGSWLDDYITTYRTF